MPHGVNNTPVVGWHPPAEQVAWLEAEVERRGGMRGARSAILTAALAAYMEQVEASRDGLPSERLDNLTADELGIGGRDRLI